MADVQPGFLEAWQIFLRMRAYPYRSHTGMNDSELALIFGRSFRLSQFWRFLQSPWILGKRLVTVLPTV